MEATRAMLHDQDLPMYLWAEVAKIAVYVQNHTPHRVLENKTPEEVFFSKKPEVKHLRIFGCPVYIHIPKEKRTKLDPSGKKGIFVVDVYVTSECILLCILYYCNPMFIPGCFYYVFESCGHAPIF